MLDPLSALAVVAACVQFLDFAWKVVTRTEGIFNKTNSVAKKDELTSVSERLQELRERLARLTAVASEHEHLFRIRDECQDIESNLSEVLEELKDGRRESWDFTGHGKSRRWPSARQALQHRWGKDHLARFERRLEDIRHNLIFGILVELSRAQQHRQNSEAAAPQNLEKIRRRAEAPPIGQEFLREIDERRIWQQELVDALLDETTSLVDLVGPDTDSFDQRSAKYFLETLAYPEMYERSNQILYAFEDTFKWLFEPKDDPSPWSDFPTWLRDDGEEGTYWISAKPGSGKSTLIKYIDTTQSTRMHLRHWAKGRHVACASFYFWSAGSKMHNSWEGLFRSLLYRILKSKPDMIARYCPRRAQVHQLFGSYNLPWTTEELNKTLCSVLAEEETTFFFLVDGLDESCEDHEKLAMYLRGLAEQKNVKICLSSRQWPAFEDAFGSCPNLQLHELTGEDIRHFAKSQLGSSRGFQEREMGDKDFANFLIEEITHKSQGVFLWVKFVVHAILNDLRAGKRKEVLKERLEKLPVDLEDLFQKLLDMIEDDDKEEAYQIFQLVKAVRNPITLLMLSFAHEDGHSKDGQSNYLLELPCKQLSCKERMSRCEIMRRGLLAHCKGLLEVVPSPTQPPANSDHECIIDNDFDPPHPARTIPDAEVCKVDQLAGCIVQYMHRTVKEFLAKPDIWSSFKGVTASKPFSAHSALSRASLIRLKTADIATITNRWYWDVVCDTLHYAARSEAMGNAALVAELDELDRVADIIARTPWPKEPGGNLIQRHMGTPHPHQRVPRKVQAHEESQMHWSAAQTRESRHSFLCLAVQFGLLSYVEEKLISGSPVEQDPYSLSLLDCAIRDPEALSALPRVPSVGFDQRLSMMKMLFEHHDDPNRVDGYKRGPWIYLAKEIKKVHSVAWKPKRVKKHSRVFLAQPS